MKPQEILSILQDLSEVESDSERNRDNLQDSIEEEENWSEAEENVFYAIDKEEDDSDREDTSSNGDSCAAPDVTMWTKLNLGQGEVGRKPKQNISREES